MNVRDFTVSKFTDNLTQETYFDKRRGINSRRNYKTKSFINLFYTY